jgi:hypothetical protein
VKKGKGKGSKERSVQWEARARLQKNFEWEQGLAKSGMFLQNGQITE